MSEPTRRARRVDASAAPGAPAAPAAPQAPDAPVPSVPPDPLAPTDRVELVPTDAVEAAWLPAPAPLPHSAPWALTFAILGLTVSLLVGWGFLIGLVGLALAIAALRRPWESRGVAVWAVCLSVLSLIYSAGWLWWASTQGPLFG